MVDNLLLSPSSINDFLQCPAKFWYIRKFKPLPIKTEAMQFGSILHNIIATYYKIIPDDLTPNRCFIYIRNAIEQVVGSQSLNTVLKKFSWHLSRFEKFEKERLSWHISPKPLGVEKEVIKPPFKGIVDAIFKKGNEMVVVDWKSGRSPNQIPDEYAIQGCIYGYLTNASEIIFYFLGSGRSLRVEYNHCEKVKDTINTVIKKIKEGHFEKKPGSHCETCPVQIPCYLDKIGGLEVLDLQAVYNSVPSKKTL